MLLILDLEDSVAPTAKEAARETVCAMVAARAWPGRETVIRVNAPGTAWFDTDFKAACAAGPDAILIPRSKPPAPFSISRSGFARSRCEPAYAHLGDDRDAGGDPAHRRDNSLCGRSRDAARLSGDGTQRSGQGDPRTAHVGDARACCPGCSPTPDRRGAPMGSIFSTVSATPSTIPRLSEA